MSAEPGRALCHEIGISQLKQETVTGLERGKSCILRRVDRISPWRVVKHDSV